jgi:signal transduction histidine kinase
MTVTLVAVVAFVLTAFAIVLFVGVRRAAWQQHDLSQLARARALASLAEHDDDGYELKLPPELTQTDAPDYLEVWTDRGVLVRSASLARGDLLRRDAAELDTPRFSSVELPDGRTGRAVQLRVMPRDEGVRTRAVPIDLVFAEGIEDVSATTDTLRNWFIVVGAAALVAIGALTALSIRRQLRGLTSLAEVVSRIDDRNLTTRVSVSGQPYELATAIGKLNELFARLEASFGRERDLTANVSHELRTPLAGLRAMLEVTAISASPVDYPAVVAKALAIVVDMGMLVENLLALARLDSGVVELETIELFVRSLVDDCWRPFAKQAASRQLRFENRVPADVVVATDRLKLRMIVGNLIANAAEYTEPGGWIEVTTDSSGLEVADSGPAIPDEHLERVFDRLWRGDTARSASGHAGIGLPLSRALAESLGMALTVECGRDGVVRFRLRARLSTAAHCPA